jgi:hypothetical protein
MANTSPCYLCRRSTAREALVRQFVYKGFNGRRKNGHVLMCQTCAGGPTYSGPSSAPLDGPTSGQTVHDHNVVVAVISLVGMVIFCAILVAVRGY